MARFFTLITLLACPTILFADDARIEAAEMRQTGETWTFSVTLRHGDTGWDDYADGWRIVTRDGEVLGYRELIHPHVQEQPFTRSLSDVVIPETIDRVYIEASTNADGWGAARMPLDVTR